MGEAPRMIAHTDMGTVLPPSCAALVWDPLDPDANPRTFSLLLPDISEDKEVAPMIILMTAMMIRARDDQEWVEDLMAWFEAQA